MKILQKYKNKKLLKVIFNDLYSIYTDAMDKGDNIKKNELLKLIEKHKLKSELDFATVYNKELEFLKSKFRTEIISCKQIVKEVYFIYGRFEYALC